MRLIFKFSGFVINSIAMLILLSIPPNTFSQSKTDTLKEVKVKGRHNLSTDIKVNEFVPGQKVQSLDSALLSRYQGQSLATLLAQQAQVFVKSYGFNGLATLSFRGASAAQSAVLWNGVPIQNAALGLADVSLLPVLFNSKVNVVYGGSAALWGSGNVGGALMLENDAPVFESRHKVLDITGGAGSFGQYSGGLKGSYAWSKWYVATNVFLQTAKNNFPYANEVGKQVNMANDHLDSKAAQLVIAHKFNDYNVASITAWWQQYEREIPPALFEPYSNKKQNDGSLRILANWDRKKNAGLWYAKMALMQDEVKYQDEAVLLATDNKVYSYYQEVGWKQSFKDMGQLMVFMPIHAAWLNQTDGNKVQDKEALAGAVNRKFFGDKLNVSLNARAESIHNYKPGVESREQVLLPGGSASYQLFKWCTLRINVQKTYRTPTLNELYYFPGGSTSLKPEQGWSEDAGYKVNFKVGRLLLHHDLSVFNREIKDWILWLGGAIWTPHNIAQVHSRGVETENTLFWHTGKWKFHFGLNTSYILSTTENSYIYNDGSIGKQIPYTPRYNGQANIGFEYRQVSFNYNHTYTGYRFMTNDESEYILPYQTGNIQAAVNTKVKNRAIQFSLQCNNIWNNQYQVVANRPMPGINWLAGFRVGVL